ncbi:hypothetical protein [Alienimonas sp. DA493]|uniref:hypothetical protein n=1 Tax=Alienimonas sp. DA493 TaxID=3373605 RepID=UPI003754CC6E
MLAPPAAAAPVPLLAPPPLVWQRPVADPEQLAAALGAGLAVFIVAGLIGLAIGTLIGAVFLRLAASWVVKKRIPFGDAFVTMLASTLAAAGITFVLGLGVGFIGGVADAPQSLGLILNVLALPIPFLIQAWVIGKRHDLSFRQALLVTLVTALLGFVVGVVIALVLLAAALVLGAAVGARG